MQKQNHKVLFLFLDGFGLGTGHSLNPFVHAKMPLFERLIQRPLLKGIDILEENLLVKEIDATLDVPGLPQSATGQTALFTGKNGSKIMGRHISAFPGEKLKTVIAQYSILKIVTENGGKATFANAYTPTYFKMVAEKKRRHSVTTLCVLAAKLPFRQINELKKGNAVYWDITNSYLNENHFPDISVINPYEAGRRLSAIADEYDLTIFECFKPDLLGHRMDLTGSVEFLNELDLLIQGILENKSDLVTLIISSDHGNMEDLRLKTHTANPVPLISIGERARKFASVKSITDIPDVVLNIVIPGFLRMNE